MDAGAATRALMAQFLSGDPEAVKHTQAQLQRAAGDPGVAVALCDMALDATVPHGIRQLSAVMLRRHSIGEHWLTAGDNPELPEAAREHFRSKLPAGLADPDSKLRTAIALCIAEIGSYDWPHRWPQLFDSLISCITSSSNPHLFDGALKCLHFFVEGIDSEVMVNAMTVLLPPMLGFAADEARSPKVRRRALSVINAGLKAMAARMGVPAYAAGVAGLVAPKLGQLMGIFSSLLRSTDLSMGGIQLKQIALSTFMLLISNYQKMFKPHAPAALETVLNFMGAFLSVYIPKEVKGDASAPGGELEYDSDGDMCGVESLAVQLMESVGSMCNVTGKTLPRLVLKTLPVLAGHCIQYAMLTANQLENWVEIPTSYIAEEEDDANDITTRNSVAAAILDVAECFGKAGMDAIGGSVSAALAGVAAGDPALAWKTHEACIFVVGKMAKPIVQHMTAARTSAKPLAMDVPAFVGYLAEVLKGAATAGPGAPYLVGRALWCGAKLCKAVPPEACGPFLAASVAGLDAAQPMPVRMAACQAFSRLQKWLPAEQIAPVLPETIKRTLGLVDLVIAGAEYESLHLTLQTLVFALKASPEVRAFRGLCGVQPFTSPQTGAANEAKLTPLFLALWAKFMNDPFLSEVATGAVGVMVANPDPATRAAVTARLMPTLTAILTGGEAYASGVLEEALQLVRVLVSNGGTPLSEPVLGLFPVIVHLCLTSADHTAIENCTDCLAQYVQLGTPQLGPLSIPVAAPGKPAGTVPGFEAVAMCVARLLHPSLTDSAALSASKLVLSVIDKMGPSMPPAVMAEFIKAMSLRLHSARMLSMIVKLLFAFALLILAHGDSVLTVLESVALVAPAAWATKKFQADNGAGPGSPPPAAPEPHTIGGLPAGAPMTGVQSLLSTWVTYQGFVQGQFNSSVTYMALCKLLTMPKAMAAVSGMNVKGESVVDMESSLYATRSQGDVKYQQVPIPVRIAVMLGRTLHSLEMADLEPEWEGDSEAEETDDDDDDASAFGHAVMRAGADFLDAEDLEELEDFVGGGDIAGMYAFDDDSDWDGPDADALDDYLGAKEHPLYEVDLAVKIKAFFGELKAAGTYTPVLEGMAAMCQPAEREFFAKTLG